MSFGNQPQPPGAPAQPAIVTRLLDLLAGEARVPEGLAEVLVQDPALTLRVLSMAVRTRKGRSLPTPAEALDMIGLPSLKSWLVQQAVELLADGPRTPEQDQAWRKAIGCAYLCEALARSADYPHPHEAYLAGLLHNLDETAERAIFPREQGSALAEDIASWRCQSFLADALRYQRRPLEALQDATPLVRILGVGRRLIEQDSEADAPIVPRLLDLQPDTLRKLRTQALARADEVLQASAEPEGDASHVLDLETWLTAGQIEAALFQPDGCTSALMQAVNRFAALEHLVASLAGVQGELAGVAAAARHLTEVHALREPIYFHFDRQAGRLVAQPLGEETALALSIPVDGSNTAAAKALMRHRPIIALAEEEDGGTSLLDCQIARLANSAGVLAIPVGAEQMQGVLLACGQRDQLTALDPDLPYLAKIGRLAAHPAAAVADTERGGQGTEEQVQWQMRTRQLAHEINNPLGIIKNYLALLRVKLTDSEGVADDLRIIHEELDRIARISYTLVTESTESRQEAGDVDVNGLLADLIKVASRGLMQQKNIWVDVRFDEGIPHLHCDRDKLKQLLLNLLLNAIEASPEHGTVTLETHRIINHKRDSQLEILLANSGAEITPETLAQLFEPVETTKGRGHAGLGLSIVKSLAEETGASVACRSYNAETVFQILLPIG